jgi:CheY-like chemotaxis protein
MANLGSQMNLMNGTVGSGTMYSIIDTTKRYVLVVEDNKMISEILEMILKHLGYEGVVAENGRIAVEKFTNFLREGVLFELILMDIIMPEMGGYESTELIRKAEREHGIGNERHFICGFSAKVDSGTA